MAVAAGGRCPLLPLLLLALVCCTCCRPAGGLGLATAAAEASRAGESQEAFVTLLYSDQYVLGVRVLGQSLKESGTKK